MEGPLAQQFAQVREAFMVASFDGLTGEQQAAAEAGYAALSAIERHVTDMEKALREIERDMEGVLRAQAVVDAPMSASELPRRVRDKARAALPAREKATPPAADPDLIVERPAREL